MYIFFTFITWIIVIISGAVSDNVIVKARRGENCSLSVRSSELNIVSRLTVRRNGTQEIFRFCSSEERNHGCKPINSSRISLRIDKEIVSVTVLDVNTSDEGVYDVEVINDTNNRIRQEFTVSLTESPETAEDIPTETPWTISLKILNITAGVIAAIGLGLVLLLIIYSIYRKKNHNAADADGAEDPEIIPLSSNTAAREATGGSLEMVDETKCPVDNNNQREEERKDLNREERERVTDKTGRTRHCVDSQNNHKG
ncbi:uncharacterized protein LOC128011930 [Carassius gibelio]|uniref:uncharacterized protein LOC128011930 n=1 Tax=Carassius gibelio TaxID=101364 RepID=UPI0022791D68|nr:uncharacterized protein LOC128011930 [Carassius gibelio]